MFDSFQKNLYCNKIFKEATYITKSETLLNT